MMLAANRTCKYVSVMYQLSLFHHLHPGRGFIKGDGTGSQSIFYGASFADENFRCPWATLIGQQWTDVTDGLLVMRKIEDVPTGPNNKPKLPVVVTQCGEMQCLVPGATCILGMKLVVLNLVYVFHLQCMSLSKHNLFFSSPFNSLPTECVLGPFQASRMSWWLSISALGVVRSSSSRVGLEGTCWPHSQSTLVVPSGL